MGKKSKRGTPAVNAKRHAMLQGVLLVALYGQRECTSYSRNSRTSQPDFANFLTDIYGAGNEDSVHHYEITQASGRTTSNGPCHTSNLVEGNSDEDGATSVSNRDYEQRLQDKYRQIRLLDKQFLGTFVNEFELLIKDQ